MPLFKYLERKYVGDMLQKGIVKVGTLSDYRRVEHNAERCDPGEGTRTRYAAPESFSVEHPDQPLTPEQQIMIDSLRPAACPASAWRTAYTSGRSRSRI